MYIFFTQKGFDGLGATYKQGAPAYLLSLSVKRVFWRMWTAGWIF